MQTGIFTSVTPLTDEERLRQWRIKMLHHRCNARQKAVRKTTPQLLNDLDFYLNRMKKLKEKIAALKQS